MKRSGEKVLSSGTVLYWSVTDVPGRGGCVEGSFTVRATGADHAEADAFLRTLQPAGTQLAVQANSYGPNASEAAGDMARRFLDALYGGSRN